MAGMAGGRGVRLTSSSPHALSGSSPGPDHPTPPSSLLYFSDEVTSWVRHPECWRHSIYSLYIPWGIQWEVGDFPDPSYLPNGGERRAWMTG